MRNKFFSVLYAINIVGQATFSLVVPVALLVVGAWLLVSRIGAPRWIYIIAIVLGFFSGLCSMIRFIMSATANLERLEKQNEKEQNENEK